MIEVQCGQVSRARNSYFDTMLKVQATKILPGEYFASREDMVIVTVVGSCVSACLRDPASGVFGMNHFMLPEGDAKAGNSARYGAYAMEMLLNEMFKLGARREHLEAKVAGGGSVLGDFSTINVGQRNAEFVVRYLRTESIPIVSSDLEGSWPRKIYLFGASGRVKIRRLTALKNDTVYRREADYRSRLRGPTVAGDVTLFA